METVRVAIINYGATGTADTAGEAGARLDDLAWAAAVGGVISDGARP